MEISPDLFTKLKSFREPELQNEIRKHGKMLNANRGDILIRDGQYLDFLPIVVQGQIRVLFRTDVLDNLAGLGTGKLREHYDAIVNGGGKFYLSGMSSKVRGITEDNIKSRPAEFALPNVLVKLAVECDRVFVY